MTRCPAIKMEEMILMTLCRSFNNYWTISMGLISNIFFCRKLYDIIRSIATGTDTGVPEDGVNYRCDISYYIYTDRRISRYLIFLQKDI